MKARVYLRLASTSRGIKVAATTRPSTEPLRSGSGETLLTLQVALVLDLPGDVFDVPSIGEVEVPSSALTPVVETIVDESEAVSS
jgi:hypothetical protein